VTTEERDTRRQIMKTPQDLTIVYSKHPFMVAVVLLTRTKWCDFASQCLYAFIVLSQLPFVYAIVGIAFQSWLTYFHFLAGADCGWKDAISKESSPDGT
jgi:hypothetical protein